MRRSLTGRRLSQKGAQMVELSGIMIYLLHNRLSRRGEGLEE